MWIWKKHLAVSELARGGPKAGLTAGYFDDGCAVLLQVRKMSICLIVFYGTVGVGVPGNTAKLEALERLVCMQKALGRQVAICADWNFVPQDLCQAGLIRHAAKINPVVGLLLKPC